MKRILATLGVTGMVLAATAVPADATYEYTTVSYNLNSWNYYTNSRTVTAGGSNIYAKAAAATFQMTWYKCSDRSVRGTLRTAQTSRWTVGTGFVAGAKWCIASYGNYVTGSQTVELWHNVYS